MEQDAASRSPWVVAAFAAALDLAVVVCAYGFVSLLTGAEVITSPEAGRLVGPAAVGASVAAVLLTLARTLRHPDRQWPNVGWPALWSWVAAVVVAGVGYAIATGTLLAAMLFGLGFGIGWFGLLIPAVAALVGSLAALVERGRGSGMDRPRWPWGAGRGLTDAASGAPSGARIGGRGGTGQYRERVEGSIEARVSHEVDRWLAWLPRWRPGTHRARVRLCTRCFGSPILAAAGLDVDVPHPVQHAFSMRMKGIIDAAVDDYTARNLPMLHREIRLAEERKSRRPYRAGEGLDPEFLGLDLDPEPVPDQPFLFTLTGLEADAAADANEPAPRPFTMEEKEALREEVRLADEFAKQLGRRICVELTQHRERIGIAVVAYVEPQVEELLADLDRELDAPGWPGAP